MKKKILLLLVAMFVLMTGCNASINSMSYSDGQYQYSQVEISVDMRNAAYKDIDKAKLYDYAKNVAALFGFNEIEVSSKPETLLLAVVKKTLLSDLEAPDDEEDKDETKQPVETGRNWFYATYEYETDNPIAVVSKQYKETALTYVEGDPSTFNTTNRSIGAVLKNGLALDTGGIKTLVVAPLLSEFPTLAGAPLSDIECNFYWGNNKNMQTNGNKIKIQGNTFYVFSTTFDQDSATIKYKMLYPVSLGWNLVAIGGGIVVVVLILLIAKKGRRNKVSAILEPDRLNKPIIIDPFDSKPIDSVNNKINPFDGY